MSTLRVDSITNAAGTAGPTFSGNSIISGSLRVNGTLLDSNGDDILSSLSSDRVESSGGSQGIMTDSAFSPDSNNARDLGTSSTRWRNVYTNDLQLSNEGSSNDVDGTWGSWTIQEGEEDLFLINRRSGKRYKFALTEVN
jgi:hypothetical protein